MSGSLKLKYDLESGVVEVDGIEKIEDLLEVVREIISSEGDTPWGSEALDGMPFFPRAEELELEEELDRQLGELREAVLEEDEEEYPFAFPDHAIFPPFPSIVDLDGLSDEESEDTIRELNEALRRNAQEGKEGFDFDSAATALKTGGGELFIAKNYCNSQGIDWVEGKKKGSLIAFDSSGPRYFNQKLLIMGPYVDDVSSRKLAFEYEQALREKKDLTSRPRPGYSQ